MSQINPVILVVVLLLTTTEKGISKGKQILIYDFENLKKPFVEKEAMNPHEVLGI